MGILIVTVHPDPASLTQRTAERLAEALGASATIAPLGQEGFDPRFTPEDRRGYLGDSEPAADVVAEQRRLDEADHLVLVFPVYWWSMPALLKGWIDRVFIAGWAFGLDEAGKVVPGLDRLTIHLLPVSGTTRESFERHGYTQSFSTQIEHGIVDFCGARRGATAFLHDSEVDDSEAIEREQSAAVAAIVAAIAR